MESRTWIFHLVTPQLRIMGTSPSLSSLQDLWSHAPGGKGGRAYSTWDCRKELPSGVCGSNYIVTIWKIPAFLRGMGGDNCYTNKFLVLLHCCMETACNRCFLLPRKQSKSSVLSQWLENIKSEDVWNAGQHFRLSNSSLIQINLCLKVLLLNSWLTLSSGSFPTLTTSAYTHKRTGNSCFQWLNSNSSSRTSVVFCEELMHHLHQGRDCSKLQAGHRIISGLQIPNTPTLKAYSLCRSSLIIYKNQWYADMAWRDVGALQAAHKSFWYTIYNIQYPSGIQHAGLCRKRHGTGPSAHHQPSYCTTKGANIQDLVTDHLRNGTDHPVHIAATFRHEYAMRKVVWTSSIKKTNLYFNSQKVDLCLVQKKTS